jgi:nuclear cap-binding protein subunit 1
VTKICCPFQRLENVLASLRTLDTSGFAESLTSFIQPYTEFENIDNFAIPAFNLPSVLVPPEILELDGLSTDPADDSQIKKQEWPEYYLQLFDNEVSRKYHCLSILIPISMLDYS